MYYLDKRKKNHNTNCQNPSNMYINFDFYNMNMPKVIMYGGSFNPIHIGHIQLAQYFLDILKPDKFLIVPDRIPPHKSNSDMASANDRIAMCNLAFEQFKDVEVSDIEIKREGKSYTIYTLCQLNEIYPNAQIFLIMGADMFLTLHTWKDYKEIINKAVICTVPRDEKNVTELINYSKNPIVKGIRCIISDSMMMGVSSSQIRENIKNGKSITNMVSYEIEDYILKNELYHS